MNKGYRDISYLRRYVDGELSPREMFDLEHAAHQDEMLMDIIMGLEFEKSHDLPNNIAELQQRINQRVHTVQPHKSFSWAKWAIAASFFIAVIGATLYLTRDKEEITDQIVYQPETNTIDSDIFSIPDTTQVHTTTAIEDNKITLAEKPVRPTEAQTPNAKEPLPPIEIADTTALAENIIAAASVSRRLTLAPENSHGKSKLVDEQALNEKMEEVIVVGTGSLKKDSQTIAYIPPVQKLTQKSDDAQMHIGSGVHSTNNPAHLRGQLSSMKIDPQTSMILNQVLDQQARQNQVDIAKSEDKRIEIRTGEIEYTYLANIKSNDSGPATTVFGQQQETARTVVFNDDGSKQTAGLLSSTPKGGWKLFDSYIGQSLHAKNIKSGYVTYLFRLDEKGVPQDIHISQSSDPTLNSSLLEILRKGPSWKLGKDSARVELELKF